MRIVPQFAPYLCTLSPSRPSFLLLSAPPKRPALPAPKIAGYLPAATSPRKVRLEIAQTPENRARMADSLPELLRSLGHWLTLDDAYAVIERHNRLYEERRAKREAEHARYMAALNDWWNQYLAARDNKTRQALIDARPSMLQAAEVQS